MYKKILGALAIVFSLAMSSSVFAHDHGCHGGMKKMLESLNLDSAQKEKIKPILENMKTVMKDSDSQMKDLSKQIKEQTMSTNMDQSTVNGLVDKKVKLIGDMIKAKVAAKNQIFAVLNDQQKAKWQDMRKKFEEKMEEKYKSCHDDQE